MIALLDNFPFRIMSGQLGSPLHKFQFVQTNKMRDQFCESSLRNPMGPCGVSTPSSE